MQDRSFHAINSLARRREVTSLYIELGFASIATSDTPQSVHIATSQSFGQCNPTPKRVAELNGSMSWLRVTTIYGSQR